MPYTIENNRRVAYTEVIKGKTKREIDKMGMSASQVRFLSLQHRKHNIGTQLTALSNRKMALARDMNKVSTDYTNRLNQSVLKWSNDSGMNYHKLNYNLMMSPNELNATLPYIVTDRATGRVVLNNDVIKDFDGNNMQMTLSDGSTKDVTYVDIAKIISEFSGMDKYSNLLFERSSGVHTGADGNVTDGSKAIDNAYFIPASVNDFSFDNNLRYYIFERLGLVDSKQIQDMNNLLVQLYGSKEAEQSGIYPVGSAWGDYYIALANQQAYADFLNNEQSVSSGNTFGSSVRKNGTFHNKSMGYEYETYVSGTGDAHSVTTQHSTASTALSPESALSHVNFKSAVYNNGTTSMITYQGDSETGAAYNAAFGAGRTLNYGTSTKPLTDGLMKGVTINITSAGITYSYDVEDILESSIKKAGPSGTNKWLENPLNASIASDEDDNVSSSMNSGNRAVFIANDDSGDVTYNQAMSSITAICNNIGNYLKTNSVTKLQQDAIDDAVVKTRNYYASRVRSHDDCWYTEGATGAASGMNNLFNYYQSAHQHYGLWYGTKHHEHHESYTIDLLSVYNVFMTYLHESQELDVHPTDASSFNDINNPVIEFTGGPADNEGADNSGLLSTKKCSDGKYYLESKASIGGVTQIQRKELSTSASSDDDETYGYVVSYKYRNSTGATYTGYYNDTSGNIAHWDNLITMPTPSDSAISAQIPSGYSLVPSSVSKVKLYSKDSSEQRLTYSSTGSSGAIGSPIPLNIPGDGMQNVYGTVKTSSNIYYFLDKTYLQNYINGTYALPGSDVSGKVLVRGTSASISGSSDVSTDIETGDPFPTDINQDSIANSRYDIRLQGYVEEDYEYSKHLESEVQEAYARIVNLQDELNNFFAGADKKLMDYYDALFSKIAKSGWMVDDKTSTGTNPNYHAEYLNNKLLNNDYFVTVCEEKADTTGYNFITKQATSVMKIFKVRDEDAENVALAEYESAKTLISSKEKKIDARMQKLETEQEAITTELQSVKKVINENIDKTFKIFA